MEPAEDPLIYRRVPTGLPRRRLRKFAEQICIAVAGGCRFCCLLTDDRELQRLNREFLGNDHPTDVLSFPEPGPDDFLGEMAISVERAREQAGLYGHSLEEEIKILMVHGLLHLLDMDHEKDRGRMARIEKRLRKQLGLPAALIERVRA